VSTLSPDSDVDLSRIRTRNDLGRALRAFSRRSGLSLAEIEKRTRDRKDPRQQLKRSTLSNAFTGRTLISPQALVSLLLVCGVPENLQRPWHDARERIETEERVAVQSPLGIERFDTASPRELGIHSAIVTPDATDDLPVYVEREFDFALRTALAVQGRGCFVVLVGGSSTGKTRSLYEAVHEMAPNWRLVQPAETEELLELKDDPPSRTVFWLDELQRYLGGHPPLSAECVRALTRKENIVVGTLWPDQYDARVVARQPATDEAEDVRRLLKSATPAAISRSTHMLCSIGSGPAARRSRRLPPSAHAVTRYGRPSSISPTACTRISRSWSSRHSSRASSWNRSLTRRSWLQFSARTLIATRAPSEMS
jgi:hypothetical protein